MARNTGNSSRKGAIKSRTQLFNGKIHLKRDKKTGQFISGKKTPYKGVTNENKKL